MYDSALIARLSGPKFSFHSTAPGVCLVATNGGDCAVPILSLKPKSIAQLAFYNIVWWGLLFSLLFQCRSFKEAHAPEEKTKQKPKLPGPANGLTMNSISGELSGPGMTASG